MGCGGDYAGEPEVTSGQTFLGFVDFQGRPPPGADTFVYRSWFNSPIRLNLDEPSIAVTPPPTPTPTPLATPEAKPMSPQHTAVALWSVQLTGSKLAVPTEAESIGELSGVAVVVDGESTYINLYNSRGTPSPYRLLARLFPYRRRNPT